MVGPKYVLDFKLIKDQVDRLLESVPNKLEREWPKSRTASSDPAFLVLVGTTSMVSNTFGAIRLLCSDKSHDWRLRPEMALVVPTLARTILDALYTCIFLFEDLPSRADWYVCSGWRELAEYIDRARRDYGSDLDWTEYLINAETNLTKMAQLIAKPPEELRTTRWWPTPQQMKSSTTFGQQLSSTISMTGSTVSFPRCPTAPFLVSFTLLEHSAILLKTIRQNLSTCAATISCKLSCYLLRSTRKWKES